jgi:hypothetical protein
VHAQPSHTGLTRSIALPPLVRVVEREIHGTITVDGDRWLAYLRLEDPPGLSPITTVGRFDTVEAAQVATDEVWAAR